MEETDGPRAMLCGRCANFMVLDDRPLDPSEWFGVCGRQVDDEFGTLARVWNVLDFAYVYGRRCRDDCENPSEWFEED